MTEWRIADNPADATRNARHARFTRHTRHTRHTRYTRYTRYTRFHRDVARTNSAHSSKLGQSLELHSIQFFGRCGSDCFDLKRIAEYDR